MVANVRSTRSVGVRSPMSELFEAWFAIAETGCAPTTIRQTRSVLDRYLHPHLGHLAVGGRPLPPGTLARIHVVLRSSPVAIADAKLGQGLRAGRAPRHCR